jgi:hypothetical membrane protein
LTETKGKSQILREPFFASSAVTVNYSNGKIGGALAFVAAAQFIVALIVAESLYPGYSVSQNFISDLGATCRATCVVVQPTATIFNSSVILLGLLTIAASYFVRRQFKSWLLPVLLVITGLGAVGVGVFPETTGVIHPIVSFITFLFAGLSAIASYREQKAPSSYFVVLLGAMTLIALSLYVSKIYLSLGQGGMERIVAYPVLIWGAAFGAGLMASEK